MSSAETPGCQKPMAAVGLAMLRWHGTLTLLTLKMRARMRGKLEAPMPNDKVCVCLCVCVRATLNRSFYLCRYVCVSAGFILVDYE